MSIVTPRRRFIVAAGAASAATLAWPALAQTRAALPAMTDGPFYPSAAWRQRVGEDWDADLTLTRRAGKTLVARGEHLGLALVVADSRGRAIDGAEVEIWQCDVLASYRHPRVSEPPERVDEGFQGFGAARSASDGSLSFKTIKPVPYPGRTPHIHVKLRHASFGELTSQLFIAGDAGNARDFLWRSLDAAGQSAAAIRLAAASEGSGLRWLAQHALVVPA
jgi:protocatechuate 3,4-dioxygenase, beta subunit